MTDSTEPDRLDLDALIQRARIEANLKRSSDAAVASVVRLLAEGEGFQSLEALLADGVPREVIADLVAEPADKRARPKGRLGIVGGDPWVWLTSTGWQAAGRASGRERQPDFQSAHHYSAGPKTAEWFALRSAALDASGVRVRIASGAVVRRFSEEVKSRAWAALKTHSDGEGHVGLLTGGLRPDSLLVARFPNTPQGRDLYARCWGTQPTEDDLAESVALLEFEFSRKGEPVRSKVAALGEAVSTLRAAQAVVFVCDQRSVADDLRALGLDDAARQPHMWLVPATALGLPGEDIGPIRRPWWPLSVPADGTSEHIQT